MNKFLTTIIWVFIGNFIGHTIFVCWDYHKSPDLYAMQSAPWYTSIITWGLISGIFLLSAIILKCIVRWKSNNH